MTKRNYTWTGHFQPYVYVMMFQARVSTMLKKKQISLPLSSLMPHQFVRHDLAGRSPLDLYDDAFVPELAEKYGVSVQALISDCSTSGM